MKKVNLFLIGLVTMIVLSVIFSSCGGGSSSNSNSSGSGESSKTKIGDMLKVVGEEYGTYGVVYYLKLKNVTNKTLDGSFKVKVKCKDGTSKTELCFVNDMDPGDIQKVSIYNNSQQTYNVSSWSFVDE